jgi:hypothetical protein
MYVPPALIVNNSAFYIYGFPIFLIVNTDYLPKQHWPVDLCNGDGLCSLRGMDWILKYLDELRLQTVKQETGLEKSNSKHLQHSVASWKQLKSRQWKLVGYS